MSQAQHPEAAPEPLASPWLLALSRLASLTCGVPATHVWLAFPPRHERDGHDRSKASTASRRWESGDPRSPSF